MNFKIYKISFVCLLLVFITSCSVEDVEPVNQLTEDIVITNETSANLVLNRIYSHQRSFNLSSLSAAIDFYGPVHGVIGGLFGSGGFQDNNVQDDNNLIESIYTEQYAIINDASFFIELVEAGNAVGLADARKNEMLSEARYFRAQAHFYLLRTFGEFYNTGSQYGVVTNTAPFRGVADAKPRNTVQETYDAIIADLQFAVTNGGARRDGIYVSATTAQALLARVYLYMGDYTNAASTSLNVINNTNGYALEPIYGDIYTKRWQSSEVLFAPFVDGNNEQTAFTDSQFNATRVGAPSPLFIGIADASDGALDGVNNIFGEPDTGYDSRFSFTYGNLTLGSLNGNNKYNFSRFSTDSNAGNTYYYLRMAEVYLIHAEAEARRSGGDLNVALGSLNDIRNRAGMPVRVLTDQATLLEDIRNDKMIELCSENAESYYDLVRYDQLGELDASSFKPTLTDDRFIFPIPAAALAGNTLLIPNPNQ